MAPYARKNLKKRPYSTRKKTSRKNAKPSKTLVKQVNSIIRKNVENKQAWLTYPIQSFNSGSDLASDVLQVMPLVPQGIAENNRIGDDIRAQKLTIRGHMISTMQGNLSYCRIAVRILVCQPKALPNTVLEGTNVNSWLPYVLRRGGSNMGLDGTPESLYAPVDTDVITCWHDKTYYISQPAQYTNVAFQETHWLTKFFNLSLNLKNKLLKYNGNFSGDNRPVAYAPVILFSYVMLDGTAPIVFGDLRPNLMSMTFTSCLEYEDA